MLLLGYSILCLTLAFSLSLPIFHLLSPYIPPYSLSPQSLSLSLPLLSLFISPQVTFQGKKEIKTVSAGSEGSFFLTTDGKVYACGSNEHNRLGFNTVTAGLRKRIVKVK